jgi:S-adenosyl methyltransferase
LWAADAGAGGDFADLAFTGLQLIAPGLVAVSEWRPETEQGLIPPPAEVGYLGAVARKP